MKWAAKAWLSGVATTVLLAGPAQAGELGLAGGAFFPWSELGDPGFNISMQILDSYEGEKLRWGAELEYRRYDNEFKHVKPITFQDGLINGVLHWRFFPDKLTPYVGLGLGLGVNVIDKKSFEEKAPLFQSFNIEKVGMLMGALAIVGVEAPIGSHFNWYLEARGEIYARIPGDGDVTFRNFSGLDARSGFRVRWR